MAALPVAAVFDRVDEQGRPYFSPNRPRIVDADERDRVAQYLATAPMALRAAGLERDPLAPKRGRVVPLHYRTDAGWVWQEASAYYLRTYGVAPEPALLEHIVASGYRHPGQLSPDALQAAATAALAPEPPGQGDRMRPDPSVTYLADAPGLQPGNRPAVLVRIVDRRPDAPVVEVLDRELRWRTLDGEPPTDLVRIAEARASKLIDALWRATAGQ